MSAQPEPRADAARRALPGGLAALAVLLAMLFALGWPLRVRVDSPRLGSPWIDRPQALMNIRLASSIPLLLPHMTLTLEGSSGAAGLRVTAHHWDGNDAVLTVSLPELPDGAYALRVRTPTQDLLLPKAVFLRRAWPQLLHLAQIADLPPPGREPMMGRFIAAMQIRKPDAVLVTGDINYGGSESNIDYIYSQLQNLDVPVIVAAGNHEREAWHRYLRLFGARDHRTDFGPLTVLSLDSAHGRDALTASAYAWLRAQLQSLAGRTVIIQIHHPLFPAGSSATSESGGTGGYLRGYRRAFLDLCRRYQVALVLSGHWHQDAVFDSAGNFRSDRSDFAGTKFVVTTALGAEARELYEQSPVRNGYRWLEFVDGQLRSYSTDAHNPVPSTALDSP
jgi:Calcineurin-like phosphoesterase